MLTWLMRLSIIILIMSRGFCVMEFCIKNLTVLFELAGEICILLLIYAIGYTIAQCMRKKRQQKGKNKMLEKLIMENIS